MELVLGIDLGTSYFKLGLFDRDGKMQGLGRVAVQADTDDTGRYEVPVDRFWALLADGVNQALEQADASAADIQAVGYSSQANSFLLLDENDQPLTPLILWTDTRAADEIDPRVVEHVGDPSFAQITGADIEPVPGLMICKLCWIAKNQPDLWSRMRRIQTISDYLAFGLTGEPVGDQGTASLLGLLDVVKGDWWDDALKRLGLQRQWLSAPLQPGSVGATVTSAGGARMGINAGIPLVVGSLDHYVAAIGAGVGQIAEFSESTGTVLACVGRTDRYHPRKGVCIATSCQDGQYDQLAWDSNGASVLEWYQKEYCPQLSVGELVALAEEVPAGCEGLTAKPQANQHDDLEGFEGATDKHTSGHYARAIMESVSRSLDQLADNLGDTARPERIIATGGGARSDLWLGMKADILQAEFVRPGCQEPACQGAAMLASVGAGWFSNLNETSKSWIAVEQTFAPKQ